MKNTGVTLIALIITIIVMLILAGVTISMIIGDNGVFTTAVEAEKEYSKAEVEEAFELLRNTKFMEAYASANENNVDISEYFNEANMLAYFTGNNETTTKYITEEGSDKLSTDALGNGLTIYKVYVLNVSEISSEVTKYGNGTYGSGDVFTLEVVADSNDSTKSSGTYNLNYYDDEKNPETLATITLYATTST